MVSSPTRYYFMDRQTRYFARVLHAPDTKPNLNPPVVDPTLLAGSASTASDVNFGTERERFCVGRREGIPNTWRKSVEAMTRHPVLSCVLGDSIPVLTFPPGWDLPAYEFDFPV